MSEPRHITLASTSNAEDAAWLAVADVAAVADRVLRGHEEALSEGADALYAACMSGYSPPSDDAMSDRPNDDLPSHSESIPKANAWVRPLPGVQVLALSWRTQADRGS
jgi:hypothetical protein